MQDSHVVAGLASDSLGVLKLWDPLGRCPTVKIYIHDVTPPKTTES